MGMGMQCDIPDNYRAVDLAIKLFDEFSTLGAHLRTCS